jgi:endonuclease YncB( thermonuclease family)
MELSKELESELAECSLGSCPKFAVSGEFFAKVVKVYDGDTITVAMKPFSELGVRQFQVRMHGYDSPEIRPPRSAVGRERTIERAREARDALAAMILDEIVLLEVLPENDKYGRLLCKVRHRGVVVNDAMVKNGHGYEYFGGAKKS